MSFRRTRITPRIVRPHRVVERLEGRRLLAILTVTTTADDGPGSLRQALVDAALNAEADTIRFDVPGPSTVHTISPPSPLPVVPAQTVIDGTTQPG